LALLADLGVWWKTKTGLPLPLGGNAVRRDLPQTIRRQIELDLRASVAWGWENRAETLAYAGRFGRGLTTGQADRFVKMYVNELTRDIGAAGRKALKLFLDAGRRKGLTPASFETFAKQTDYFE
jgi:1,4-dihydroxy-6-naphthoate synthase